MSGGWDCEAYGPDGREAGALCFFASELGIRVCDSQERCHRAMLAERQRVFRRISERAAQGDPDMAYLAEVFTGPSQILGGGDAGQ